MVSTNNADIICNWLVDYVREARALLVKRRLSHASMSIGDAIQIGARPALGDRKRVEMVSSDIFNSATRAR